MDKAILVQNIKKYCILRGVKPTIACAESGAGKNIINKLESRGSVPSVERVQLLAQYLGVTVSDLLGEVSEGGPGGPAPPALAEDELRLLSDYRALNPQGQEYIRQTMHMAKQTYKKMPDLSKLENQA